MAISSADTRYLQKHLAPHLIPYARLVAPIVDKHVGWLPRDDEETGQRDGNSVTYDVDAGLDYTVLVTSNPDPISGLIQECALLQQRTFTREFALTVGMGALAKAWDKWQESQGRFNEAQFIVYARRCILGAIFKELKPAIEARYVWAEEQAEVRVTESELLRREREDRIGASEATERENAEQFSQRYVASAREKLQSSLTR